LVAHLVVREHLVARGAGLGRALEIAAAVAEHVAVERHREAVLADELLPELLAVIEPASRRVLVRGL
jgi:hypothetical protein